MPKDKLTEKQVRFCQEYIVDLNATQAAIRSGYSEDTAGSIGSENLTKPEILEHVNELLAARAERTKVNADYVISSLKEVVDRCLQKKAVMYYDKVDKEYKQRTAMVDDGQGNYTEEGIWEFDSAGANKALETLAKHLKLLTEKHELTGPEGSPLLPPMVIFKDKEEPVASPEGTGHAPQ
jgi:phage terminase small subunit